jgi:hypothetical protein
MKSAMLALISIMAVLAAAPARADDALPSWNEGPTKKAITDFVARVTRDGSANFVPPAERIAVFDNDGTLWSEQPLYFQAMFAIDRIKAIATDHPDWVAGDRIHRRRTRQAGGDQQLHRPPASDGVRQLRWRPANVAVDDRRPWATVWPDRVPHRRGSRMGLQPPVVSRAARQGARPRPREWVDRRGHEERLENHLPVREITRRDAAPVGCAVGFGVFHTTSIQPFCISSQVCKPQ